MTKLPKQINAIKCIPYDVQQIVEYLMAQDDLEDDSTITLEMVMDWIKEWVEEDYINNPDIVFQDEKGKKYNV